MIHYQDDTITLHHGDCVAELRTLADNSIDAIVTDPPYGLEFMGKDWDAPWKAPGTVLDDPASVGGFQDGNGGNPYSRSRVRFGIGIGFQLWCQEWATECLRVLKPGGHMLAFGGTRTWHRLACAVEDAGFEIRDSIAWMHGSGFPKSLDVSKAIDKAAGAEREVIGPGINHAAKARHAASHDPNGGATYLSAPAGPLITAPATDAAREWQGWGTAMKPAFEPVVMARKPLVGTVAANVLAHGTGAINVDGCRIEYRSDKDKDSARPQGAATSASGSLAGKAQLCGENSGQTELSTSAQTNTTSANSTTTAPASTAIGSQRTTFQPTEAAGRWPANVALDTDMAAVLDAQSGTLTSGKMPAGTMKGGKPVGIYGEWKPQPSINSTPGDSVGGASRFFFVAKAPSTERPNVDGEAHATVKPLDLMRWLIRLITPPGGVVLDPFAGSGTTLEAAGLEGFRAVGIEREADYLPLIVHRIQRTPIALFDDGEAS